MQTLQTPVIYGQQVAQPYTMQQFYPPTSYVQPQGVAAPIVQQVPVQNIQPPSYTELAPATPAKPI